VVTRAHLNVDPVAASLLTFRVGQLPRVMPSGWAMAFRSRSTVLLALLSTMGSSSPTHAECDASFVRANAIFTEAATLCRGTPTRNAARYYSLAMARQCDDVLSEAELAFITKQTIDRLEQLTKQRGKKTSCAFVEEVGRAIVRAADRD
jgi:hypothetical protein